MFKRLTVFLAATFALTASSFAQQPVVISTGPNPGVHFIDGAATVAAPPYKMLVNNLPYIQPVQETPTSLVLVPVDTAFNILHDTSDTSFAISENGQIVAFTIVPDFPAGGAALGFTLVSPAQFFPPMGGNLTIDSVRFLMFKLRDSANLPANVNMLPVLTPTNINWQTYTGFRRDFDEFPSIPGVPEFYVIPKEEINSALNDQTITYITVRTPGMEISANSGFGFIFIPDFGLNREFRMFGGYEWNTAIKPTGGAYIRPTVGTDSVMTIFGNLIWGATSPAPLTNKPIRQNFEFIIFGTLDVTTDVRPEPSYEATGVTLEANYPNPAVQETHIRFSIEKTAPVTLRLTDMLGQVVQKATFEDRGPGSYVWDINTAALANGTYFYTLTTGETTITRTMTVAR